MNKPPSEVVAAKLSGDTHTLRKLGRRGASARKAQIRRDGGINHQTARFIEKHLGITGRAFRKECANMDAEANLDVCPIS